MFLQGTRSGSGGTSHKMDVSGPGTSPNRPLPGGYMGSRMTSYGRVQSSHGTTEQEPPVRLVVQEERGSDPEITWERGHPRVKGGKGHRERERRDPTRRQTLPCLVSHSCKVPLSIDTIVRGFSKVIDTYRPLSGGPLPYRGTSHAPRHPVSTPLE